MLDAFEDTQFAYDCRNADAANHIAIRWFDILPLRKGDMEQLSDLLYLVCSHFFNHQVLYFVSNHEDILTIDFFINPVQFLTGKVVSVTEKDIDTLCKNLRRSRTISHSVEYRKPASAAHT